MANITVTTADAFIPTLWSSEVLSFYRKRTVMRALVKVYNHTKMLGEALVVPKFTITNAVAKVADTALTPTAATQTSVTISLNKQFAVPARLEDIVAVQAQPSFREEITRGFGEALAREKDYLLQALAPGLQGGTQDTTPGTSAAQTMSFAGTITAVVGVDGSTIWDPAANTNAGNASHLTDAGIRQMLTTLQNNDVDIRDIALVVPPVSWKNLAGIARFTEQAFVGDEGGANTIHNGMVGDLYGVKVYVSTLSPSLFAANGTTAVRSAIMFNRDALGLAEQMTPRVRAQLSVLDVATNIVADELYGVQVMRPEAGIAVVVPNV